ncbi:hypothetical protein AAHC03_017095 [Spirometra sp. Aus1]
MEITVKDPFVGPPGEVVIQVEYKGAEADVATSVNVIIDWGDGGTPEIVSSPNFTSPLILRHSMLRDNICLCQVVLDNQVSTINKTFEIGYFKPLFATDLDIFIGDLNAQGYGKERNKFTLNDRLRFVPWALDGTIEKTHIILRHTESDTVVLNVTFREPSYLFEVTELGHYTMHVKMSNFLTSFQVTKSLVVETLIRDLRVVLLSSSLIPYEDGQIAVKFLGLANDACLCLSLGNGDNLVFKASEDAPKICVPCPNYTLAGTLTKTSNQATIRVQYPIPGQYLVRAVAHAGPQTVCANLSVSVWTEHCSLPRVHLQNPNYADPNSPQWITTLDWTTVAAISDGHICRKLGSLIFKWSLWRLAEKTAERTGEIVLQQNVGRTNFQIFLPPYLLRPGLYEVELTGWLEGVGGTMITPESAASGRQVISGLSTFLAVEEARLTVQFTEDNADVITVGTEDSHFCLAPANFSYDPNVETRLAHSVITNWTIICQAHKLEQSNAEGTELAVCPLAPVSAGVVCLKTAQFDHSKVYTFTARGSSRTQSGTGTVNVVFMPGRAPQLKIRLARPQLSMKAYHDGTTCISPTNDLILHGECVGQCGTSPAYQWDLQILADDGELQNVTTSKLLGVADDYTSSTLVIKASALSELTRSMDLRVCLVSVGLPSRPRVCRVFCLAEPPLLGECHLNVTGPISADTRVSISCEGNGDSGGPLIYRFYSRILIIRLADLLQAASA